MNERVCRILVAKKKMYVFNETLLKAVKTVITKYALQDPVILALNAFLCGDYDPYQKYPVFKHLVEMLAEIDKEATCDLISIYCQDNHNTENTEAVLLLLSMALGNSTYEAAATELLQAMEEQNEFDTFSADEQISLAKGLQRFGIHDARTLSIKLLSKASELSKKAELELACYLAEISDKPYKIEGLTDVLEQFSKKHPEASYALAVISFKHAKHYKKGSKKHSKQKDQATQHLESASKRGYRIATERLLEELKKEKNKLFKADEIHCCKKRLRKQVAEGDSQKQLSSFAVLKKSLMDSGF